MTDPAPPTSVPWPGAWSRGPSIDALSTRVDGLERTLQDVVNMVRSMETNLGDRIDKQAAKPTNLLQLGGFMVAALSVFGGFAWYAKSGVDTDIARVERKGDTEETNRMHDVEKVFSTLAPIAAVAAQHDNDLRRVEADERIIDSKWSKDAQQEYERRIDDKLADRKEDALRTIAGIQAEIISLSSEMVSRSEHEFHWKDQEERYTSLSARLNEMQHEFGTNFTIGDAVKSLQSELRELRYSNGGPPFQAVTPVAPIAPLAPIAPVAPIK
jgi:hypothetical protein